MGAFLEETPRRVNYVIANPAVGAELVINPVGMGGWRLLNLVYTLTTSAVVATRATSLRLSDGNATYWYGVPLSSQTASSANIYQYTERAQPAALTGGLVQLALPAEGLYIPRGWSARTVTAAIDVGDQYSVIAVLIQELPDGPDYLTEPGMYTNLIPSNE